MPLSNWHKFQFNFLYIESIYETVKAWGLNSFHRVFAPNANIFIIGLLLFSGEGGFKNHLTNCFLKQILFPVMLLYPGKKLQTHIKTKHDDRYFVTNSHVWENCPLSGRDLRWSLANTALVVVHGGFACQGLLHVAFLLQKTEKLWRHLFSAGYCHSVTFPQAEVPKFALCMCFWFFPQRIGKEDGIRKETDPGLP